MSGQHSRISGADLVSYERISIMTWNGMLTEESESSCMSAVALR